MNFDDVVRDIWGEPDGPASPYCGPAKQFAEFAEVLYQAAQEDATRATPYGLVTVNQKKLLLLDKYFEYRGVVPKAHRNHFGQFGHRCLWHVFEEYYNKLRVIELHLTPPMLYLPPPPPAQLPPPQFDGLMLGEVEK
jgi:hypothetical protein